MYYKRDKVTFRRGSYIDFRDWIKNKKATINLKSEDDWRFQYAAAVALTHPFLRNKLSIKNRWLENVWEK